ncbi:MAG: sulfatase-like hydrolase/transferase, partial [Verrucomicrobiota bacterium]
MRLANIIFVALSSICSAAGKPNILFLAVDDLRPELGCYGVETVHSPFIDRFAASAVTFERAYCQVAVCNPSRVSLLTGLRPDSSKVWDLRTRFRETVPDVVTLPQHFKRHGYHAVSFGKIFHNPWPDNQSWSVPHAWPKNAGLWSDEARRRHSEFRERMRVEGKSDAVIERMRAAVIEALDVADHEHIDGAIARQAIEAMRRLHSGDKPFFLAAGFVRPHLPFVVPRKYWDLYDRDEIPLAANPHIPKQSPSFAMNTMYELRDYMDYADVPDPRDGTLSEARQRELKHGYLASVSFIDAQIGLILEELEKLGLAENTIVVLWSDHGWKLGEHNSWCKQTNYEIDARVPLIIRSPGAGANGKATPTLAELLDLFPTLCDLAGLDHPEHIEGDSLVPVLSDPTAEVKDAAFSQFKRRDGDAKRDLMGYAMRTDRFRYVEWIDRRTKEAVEFELYDHLHDPGETKNLAVDPSQEKWLRRLSAQLWNKLPAPPDYVATAPNEARPVIHFRNQREDRLTVYWLPEKGPRKKTGIIEPGQTLTQRTTKGHRFIVVGSRGNESKVHTVTRQNAT